MGMKEMFSFNFTLTVTELEGFTASAEISREDLTFSEVEDYMTDSNVTLLEVFANEIFKQFCPFNDTDKLTISNRYYEVL